MTPATLIILSLVVTLIGAFLWAWGVDEFLDWAVVIGIILSLGGLSGFVGGMIWHGETTTTVETMNVDENLETVSFPDDNSTEENQATKPPPEKKEEKLKDPTSWPRKWPGNDASKDNKDAWWTDWANNVMKNETTIVCEDGVQVEVIGNADGETGETQWANIRTRVHPDGKPFTCDESKDPSQEITK